MRDARRVTSLPWLVAGLIAIAAEVGCEERPPARSGTVLEERHGRPEIDGDFIVPSRDRGTLCADLPRLSDGRASRVCWGVEGIDEIGVGCVGSTCVVERESPRADPSTPMGWRCVGTGPDRRCFDRSRAAPAFLCEGDRCVQRHPRLPDDGEWTCAGMAGAAVCAGGDPPAGVVPGPVARGFFCGARPPASRPARRDAGVGRRVCVDFSPDFPDGAADAWRCRYEHDDVLARVCERQDGLAVLGARCDSESPCVDGAVCVASRCVPDPPRPGCWIDADCSEGECRFATCRREP